MWVRIQELAFPPDQTDRLVRRLRDTAMCRYDGDGLRGFRLLVDRPNGKALDVSYWDSAMGAHAAVTLEPVDPSDVLDATLGAATWYELTIDAG